MTIAAAPTVSRPLVALGVGVQSTQHNSPCIKLYIGRDHRRKCDIGLRYFLTERTVTVEFVDACVSTTRHNDRASSTLLVQ